VIRFYVKKDIRTKKIPSLLQNVSGKEIMKKIHHFSESGKFDEGEKIFSNDKDLEDHLQQILTKLLLFTSNETYI
jgi:hypothetical protein